MTNVTPRTIRNVEAELTRLRRENAELRKALETFSAEVDRQSRPGGQWVGIPKYAIRDLFAAVDTATKCEKDL